MEYNPSLTPAYLAGKVDEYVKFAARDTIKRNAKRDRNARWARIPDGESCDFCRMLGSRGFVYHSEETAGGDSHGTEKDPYHPFCNCQIAVCFDPFIEEYYKGWTKVTRGYGDGEVTVPGRDGSDALREVDIDELYEEYRAMLRDFNSGKRSSKYKDYTLGAKLTDEQFDAAMKRLAYAKTRDELHDAADDIVAKWPANSNGRFKRQWDELSRLAKARERELKEAAESRRRWTSDEKMARIKDIESAMTSEKPVFILPNEINAKLLRNIEKVKPEEGYYDIHAHGSPFSVNCYGTSIEANDLAFILSKRDDYHGQKIRLFSCRAGAKDADGDCFARRLSDIIGVEVKAAPDVTIIREDGTFYFGRPDVTDFEVFDPKK